MNTIHHEMHCIVMLMLTDAVQVLGILPCFLLIQLSHARGSKYSSADLPADFRPQNDAKYAAGYVLMRMSVCWVFILIDVLHMIR